jgi:hypothetical protein
MNLVRKEKVEINFYWSIVQEVILYYLYKATHQPKRLSKWPSNQVKLSQRLQLIFEDSVFHAIAKMKNCPDQVFEN